jgi:hypothetical protein
MIDGVLVDIFSLATSINREADGIGYDADVFAHPESLYNRQRVADIRNGDI